MGRNIFRIPVVIYRGGTSKGIFIKENSLPRDPVLRDQYICRIFGSPDSRQIDGLGGADPLTSKVAIVSPPSVDNADIDYLFGQVDIHSQRVLYDAVCGNLSAAVGPYAIEEGFVKAREPATTVRIYSRNIDSIIKAEVLVEENRVKTDGDYSIDGVPGMAAPILLNWSETVGANSGSLLPTGQAKNRLEIEGLGDISVSIVDVGNIGVFVNAEDLNLKGIETPEEIDAQTVIIDFCEKITQTVKQRFGLNGYVTIVAPPKDYVCFSDGSTVRASEVDVLVRMIFMRKLHKAYAASQINCCGAAASIEGSVVNECLRNPTKERKIVRMGHPSGIADLTVKTTRVKNEILFLKLEVGRTARRLLEGYTFLSESEGGHSG